MTYGANDGSTVGDLHPSVNKAVSGPQAYNGGLYTDSSKGHLDQSEIPPVRLQNIPQEGANGKTSVDTSSLKQFADNLDTLAEALGKARDRVDQMPVLAAGAFKEAKELEKVVSGGGKTPPSDGGKTPPSGSPGSPDVGLRGNYHKALHDLRQVLMESALNVRTLANKYATIEEINRKAGKDLSNLISKAENGLQTLQHDPL
ncbi:hypothetical protein ACGFWI_13770 [Streptomyces sp. NPDC048434]|uniref:hypothetical protein n=1 Tax=Streptomyces sp. NPDC048434 TaxID=3365549 RepID=UPI003715FFD7